MSFFTSSSDGRNSWSFFATIVICIVLFVFAASEWMVRNLIVPQDDFRANAALFGNSTEIDAIFGDSHAARGLVPNDRMINLAYPSEGIEQMGWKVGAYYADKKPGRVIIQADPHLFAPYRLVRSFGDYPAQFEEAAAPVGWKPLVFIPRYRSNLVNYWSSFFRSGGNLQSRIKILKNGALLSPGNLAEVDDRLRLFQARQRIKVHTVRPRDKIQKIFRTYNKMLGFLKSQGATICLLTYPLSPDYLAALENGQNDAERLDRQAIMSFFTSEAKRVGARYVDLQAQITDRKDFRDVDHLNGDAAIRHSPGFIKQCFG